MTDINRFAADWIGKNIDQFHEEKRLKKLRELKLSDLTGRKNPYLFKVKSLNIAADIVRGFMEAAIRQYGYADDDDLLPHCCLCPVGLAQTAAKNRQFDASAS